MKDDLLLFARCVLLAVMILGLALIAIAAIHRSKVSQPATVLLNEDERICYIPFKEWELTNIYRQAKPPLEVTTNEHRRLTNWMRIQNWQRSENGWGLWNTQFDPVLLDSNSFTIKESDRFLYHFGHKRGKWKEEVK